MSEDGTTYAIRFRRRAQTDTQEALIRLAEVVSPDHAVAWYSGLQNTLAKLATLPKRWPIADQRRFFRDEVRVTPYRYSPGVPHITSFSPSPRLRKTPLMSISCTSATARKPMTRAEARKIEAEE